MTPALEIARPQVADRRQSARGDSRRRRRRKDEAGRKAANEVAQRRRCRDVAADDAKRLGQGALDNRQAVTEAVAFGDPAAARSVSPTACTSSR
jgi:hypothetical protein